MKKYCEQCGKEIDQDKRGDSRFCQRECQNRYNYLQRKSGLGADLKLGHEKPPIKEMEIKDKSLDETLKGVIDQDEINEEKFKNSYKTPSIDSQFFSELMGETVFNVDNKLEQADNVADQEETEAAEKEEGTGLEGDIETPNNTLPEKYIMGEVKTENPIYKQNEKRVRELQDLKHKLEQEYKKLEAELKIQEGRNGNELITYGGLGAGLFGFLNTKQKQEPEQSEGDMTLKDRKGKTLRRSKKNKWEKKIKFEEDEKPNFWQRIGNALIYGAIGTGAGFIAKGATEDWREKDKKEKIAAIKNRMEAIMREHPQTIAGINRTKKQLGEIPKLITTAKQLINPEYEKALNGINQQNDLKQDQVKKNKPKRYKSGKIIPATELGEIEYKALNFKGLWREFFGLPSLNFHILIHGNSGEGKSTFSLWFARYLAEGFGSVLYVSGEEGVNKTFHDKLKYCKAEVDDLHILDVRTVDEFMQEVNPNEFHFIVLDSLHDMEIDARQLKAIFERYKNSAFICIDQNNKKGDLFGANEKKHICDVVVNVKNYIAETTKNRFKAKNMVFKTSDFIESDKSKNNSFKPKKPGGKDEGYNLDSDRRGIV